MNHQPATGTHPLSIPFARPGHPRPLNTLVIRLDTGVVIRKPGQADRPFVVSSIFREWAPLAFGECRRCEECVAEPDPDGSGRWRCQILVNRTVLDEDGPDFSRDARIEREYPANSRADGGEA